MLREVDRWHSLVISLICIIASCHDGQVGVAVHTVTEWLEMSARGRNIETFTQFVHGADDDCVIETEIFPAYGPLLIGA